MAEGKIESMITPAITGAENQVWSGLKYYYEINSMFPKNIVFVNVKAFSALPASMQQAVMRSAAAAELRGATMSRAAGVAAAEELRRNGIKIEQTPYELSRDLKRFGEKFSREWVAKVGNSANEVFVPFYFR